MWSIQATRRLRKSRSLIGYSRARAIDDVWVAEYNNDEPSAIDFFCGYLFLDFVYGLPFVTIPSCRQFLLQVALAMSEYPHHDHVDWASVVDVDMPPPCWRGVAHLGRPRRQMSVATNPMASLAPVERLSQLFPPPSPFGLGYCPLPHPLRPQHVTGTQTIARSEDKHTPYHVEESTFLFVAHALHSPPLSRHLNRIFESLLKRPHLPPVLRLPVFGSNLASDGRIWRGV